MTAADHEPNRSEDCGERQDVAELNRELDRFRSHSRSERRVEAASSSCLHRPHDRNHGDGGSSEDSAGRQGNPSPSGPLVRWRGYGDTITQASSLLDCAAHNSSVDGARCRDTPLLQVTRVGNSDHQRRGGRRDQSVDWSGRSHTPDVFVDSGRWLSRSTSV